MELKQLTYKDGFWWCISALLGSIVWIIPIAVNFGLAEEGTLLLATISLLLLGAVIGFLRPTRPWRWGIASVLLLPFAEIVRFAVNSSEMTGQGVSIIAVVLTELVKIPVYGLIAIPAILGAYSGSYLKQKTVKSKIQVINKNTSLPWMSGLLLGFLASGIPSYLAAVYEFKYLLPYWVVGLFIAGVTMGVTYPIRVWRWGIAVGLGLPIVVIVKIIMDISHDASSHNLFPFEILIALFIAAVSSFPGVYLGALVRQIIHRFGIGRKSEGT
jgi:hypothetical protein